MWGAYLQLPLSYPAFIRGLAFNWENSVVGEMEKGSQRCLLMLHQCFFLSKKVGIKLIITVRNPCLLALIWQSWIGVNFFVFFISGSGVVVLRPVDLWPRWMYCSVVGMLIRRWRLKENALSMNLELKSNLFFLTYQRSVATCLKTYKLWSVRESTCRFSSEKPFLHLLRSSSFSFDTTCTFYKAWFTWGLWIKITTIWPHKCKKQFVLISDTTFLNYRYYFSELGNIMT